MEIIPLPVDKLEGSTDDDIKELPIGKSATLTVVGGEGALRQHFWIWDYSGADVTMVKYAPMGDPVELRIHSYELTLRLADAEKDRDYRCPDEIKIKNQIPKEKIDHPGLEKVENI
mgnify:CR=1 FL=1